MTLEAIVFDLDDTLYLEREFVRSGFCAAGEWFRDRFRITDFADRAGAEFLAGKRGNIFDSVLASYGIAPQGALVEKLVSAYRDHLPSISLLEDARNCLNALHGVYPLALITDGPRLTQWNKIRALGIEVIFNVIVVTSELGLGYSKPHPRAFRLVEERMGLHGEQLMYLGDNPRKDFDAPQQLGWQTVWVERKAGIYFGNTDSAQTDHRIVDLSELLALPQVSSDASKQSAKFHVLR